ncbi:MAG: hypothetical protein WCJ81_05740 [bacterium]
MSVSVGASGASFFFALRANTITSTINPPHTIHAMIPTIFNIVRRVLEDAVVHVVLTTTLPVCVVADLQLVPGMS